LKRPVPGRQFQYPGGCQYEPEQPPYWFLTTSTDSVNFDQVDAQRKRALCPDEILWTFMLVKRSQDTHVEV